MSCETLRCISAKFNMSLTSVCMSMCVRSRALTSNFKQHSSSLTRTGTSLQGRVAGRLLRRLVGSHVTISVILVSFFVIVDGRQETPMNGHHGIRVVGCRAQHVVERLHARLWEDVAHTLWHDVGCSQTATKKKKKKEKTLKISLHKQSYSQAVQIHITKYGVVMQKTSAEVSPHRQTQNSLLRKCFLWMCMISHRNQSSNETVWLVSI